MFEQQGRRLNCHDAYLEETLDIVDNGTGRAWDNGRYGLWAFGVGAGVVTRFALLPSQALQVILELPYNAANDAVTPYVDAATSGNWEKFDSQRSLSGFADIGLIAAGGKVPAPNAGTALGRMGQAAVVGGGFSSAFNVVQQNREIASGRRAGFSVEQNVAATGVGVLLGGGFQGSTESPAVADELGAALGNAWKGAGRYFRNPANMRGQVDLAPMGEGSAASEEVEWFHGSLDAAKVRSEGFQVTNKYGDPRSSPFVCVSTDCAAAENAIDPGVRYDAKWADRGKLGMVEGRMSRAEWDRLHAEGHLRTNPYQGFDESITSTETKAITPEGVDALNRSMMRPK